MTPCIISLQIHLFSAAHIPCGSFYHKVPYVAGSEAARGVERTGVLPPHPQTSSMEVIDQILSFFLIIHQCGQEKGGIHQMLIFLKDHLIDKMPSFSKNHLIDPSVCPYIDFEIGVVRDRNWEPPLVFETSVTAFGKAESWKREFWVGELQRGILKEDFS